MCKSWHVQTFEIWHHSNDRVIFQKFARHHRFKNHWKTLKICVKVGTGRFRYVQADHQIGLDVQKNSCLISMRHFDIHIDVQKLSQDDQNGENKQQRIVQT